MYFVRQYHHNTIKNLTGSFRLPAWRNNRKSRIKMEAIPGQQPTFPADSTPAAAPSRTVTTVPRKHYKTNSPSIRPIASVSESVDFRLKDMSSVNLSQSPALPAMLW
jgi:hypothetical protein